MIEASGIQYISSSEAARRLGVTPRRVYMLVAANRLRAERIGGRLLIDGKDVDARLSMPSRVGRPFSARRAWGLILLASGENPPGLDQSTKSKLRRVLREHDLWSIRSRLAGRAERKGFRAHSSDLSRLDAEPDIVASGARHAAEVGLGLVAADAPVEAYVDHRGADRLVEKYRLTTSARPNVILRVVPDKVRPWLDARIAPRLAMALDLAEDADPRSQDVAREALARP
jgi:excisionase family DNA binding protein